MELETNNGGAENVAVYQQGEVPIGVLHGIDETPVQGRELLFNCALNSRLQSDVLYP